jgi:hypothetical protein
MQRIQVAVGDLVKLVGTDGPFATVVHVCAQGFETEWDDDVTASQLDEALRLNALAVSGRASGEWTPVFIKTRVAQFLEDGSVFLRPGPFEDQ